MDCDAPGGSAAEAEVHRRAEILRRYVALQPPTREDDVLFAEELGLTTDSLLRLAAAWRAHGSEALLRGGRLRRPRLEGEARNEILAHDLDMEGVEPSRRGELLRRIRIIQGYLAGDDGPDRGAAAAEMGVSPTRFDALVREWTMHRRPSLMPGAAAGSPRWYRRSDERQRVDCLLERIVRDADADVPVRTLHEHLLTACAAEGLRPLGISQTYQRVREIRSRSDLTEGTP